MDITNVIVTKDQKTKSAPAIAEMVSLLNGVMQDERIDLYATNMLRQLTDAWIAADYTLDHWPYTTKLVEKVKPVDFWFIQPDGQPPQFLPIYSADEDPYEDQESEANLERRGIAKAYRLFATFITSPDYADLHQCERCQKYFVTGHGHRNTKYCSSECAHHHSAVTATLERFRRQRREKINRVKDALMSLGGRPNRSALLPEWKEWVANKAAVDVRFVTRVVRENELKLPGWIPPRFR
jgi:hypothetical protein